MQGSGERSLAYVAAAILVAGVLVSATLILAPMARSPTTVTETSVTTATETTTLTSVTTSTETTTSTSVVTLPAGCSSSQSKGYTSGTLVAGSASPAIVCLQVYWFDSNATITLGAMSLLLPTESAVRGVSPLEANFTVTASPSQLLLGGPTNANEGTVVAYSITPKPGASGTYPLTVQESLQPLQDQALVVQALALGALYLTVWGCMPPVYLVAGNGQPNYVPPTGNLIGCGGGGGGAFSIPGESYQVPPDVVCYRIISLTNSTQ